MLMRRTFLATLALFLLVWGFTTIDQVGKNSFSNRAEIVASLTPTELQFLADNPTIRAQVAEIDRQLGELEAMKKGFEARALRHEDQAQRLQFEDRALLETRRHYELADENRAKAEKVQQEIDRLQVEKRKLLQLG
jgi:hypothetical protein